MSGIVGDNLYRASGVIAAAAGGGGVSWQDVVTASTLTAVAGNGYPINTTSNACTVTLPAAASVGDQIIFTDYARNWATNALTLNPNSLNFQGNSSPNAVYNTAGQSVHIVYMDATKGWIPISDDDVTLETPQTYDCEYLIVAGGGGGGYRPEPCGGGGAGGYLTNYGGSAISLTPGTSYTVTVGAGGVGRSSATDGNNGGGDGGNSALTGSDITDITATGGGGGAGGALTTGGHPGGSGGGGYYDNSPGEIGGEGNTPATSPSQGYDGGDGSGGGAPAFGSGGGGGSSSVGTQGSSTSGGCGGEGTSNSITGSAVYYAAGGGGGSSPGGSVCASTDSIGGVGSDAASGEATAGTDYTGSGGGSGDTRGGHPSGAGGVGIVILRMADGDYSGTTTGSPTVATNVGGSGETTVKYTGEGTYTG